jgi:hypothetical protein
MSWINLNLDDAEVNLNEFTNAIIFPINSDEYLLFSDVNVFEFIEPFSVFIPIGYKMAYTAKTSKLRNLYNSHVFRCMYVNRQVWLQIPPKFELKVQDETINELPEQLTQYLDTEKNVNPLLIFIHQTKEKVETLKKIAQIGFPYRLIIGSGKKKIIDERIYESLPYPDYHIYNQFKKEINYLINKYPDFFRFLIYLPDVKDNFPKFVSETIHNFMSKRESELKTYSESRLPTMINSVSVSVRHPDKIIREGLVEKINKLKTLPFEKNCEVSLSAKSYRVDIQERYMYSTVLERYYNIPRSTSYHVAVLMLGEIPPHKLIRYLEDFNKILNKYHKSIKKVDGRPLSIRVTKLKVMLPKENYEILTKLCKFLVTNYKLEVKLGGLRGKPFFSGSPIYFPLNVVFLIGVDITANKRSMLDEAFVLTRIAVKLILDGHFHIGTELLTATRKAIEEDMDLIKSGKNPQYTELINCVNEYQEDRTIKGIAKLIDLLLGNSPPVTSSNLDLCEKYYKINETYLNYSKTEDFFSLKSFMKIRTRLINESDISKIHEYKQILKSILKSMRINLDSLDYLGDLLFLLE